MEPVQTMEPVVDPWGDPQVAIRVLRSIIHG